MILVTLIHIFSKIPNVFFFPTIAPENSPEPQCEWSNSLFSVEQNCYSAVTWYSLCITLGSQKGTPFHPLLKGLLAQGREV